MLYHFFGVFKTSTFHVDAHILSNLLPTVAWKLSNISQKKKKFSTNYLWKKLQNVSVLNRARFLYLRPIIFFKWLWNFFFRHFEKVNFFWKSVFLQPPGRAFSWGQAHQPQGLAPAISTDFVTVLLSHTKIKQIPEKIEKKILRKKKSVTFRQISPQKVSGRTGDCRKIVFWKKCQKNFLHPISKIIFLNRV